MLSGPTFLFLFYFVDCVQFCLMWALLLICYCLPTTVIALIWFTCFLLTNVFRPCSCSLPLQYCFRCFCVQVLLCSLFDTLPYLSDLRDSFDHISGVAADMESEWVMFRAAIAEDAVQSCDCKVTGASHDGNHRTMWWTAEVKGTVSLKKESYKAWLASGTPEAADNWLAKQCASLTVTKAKTQMGGIQWGHGKRLPDSVKGILANCAMIQEGKASLFPHCVWWGRGAADNRTAVVLRR